MSARTKSCFRCGAEKPLTDFYKHPMMRDGRLNKCKECTRNDMRANRAANADYYRAYDRARGYRPATPEKTRARAAARVLQKMPCEACGEERAEAHHDDYSKPLDVRWLCKRHHAEIHIRQESA